MYVPMIMKGKVSINSFGKQLVFFDLALPDQACFFTFFFEALLLLLLLCLFPLPDEWGEAFFGRSFLTL
jgi:hypothetical protein